MREISESLLAEFDEMGYEPTTLCPNYVEERENYKSRLRNHIESLEKEIDLLKKENDSIEQHYSDYLEAEYGKHILG